jgi:glutathione S-transferase
MLYPNPAGTHGLRTWAMGFRVKDAQASPDYQAINPQNLVPTLQDNRHTITQSLTIQEKKSAEIKHE